MKQTIKTSFAIFFAVLLLGTPGWAQLTAGPFSGFPTLDETDARFLSAVSLFAGLSNEATAVGLAVPQFEADGTTPKTQFLLRLFDGDTGKACVIDCVPGFEGLGHWDDGTGNRQLRVRMYLDPNREGNDNPADLVGEWFGNETIPTSGDLGNGAWIADSQMPDNDWWNVIVDIHPGALSPSGSTSFYHVVIDLDPNDAPGTSTVSNYKVAADVPLSVFSQNFGFEAGLGGVFNDLLIVYPDFTFPDDLSNPDFFVDRVSMEGGTTYDGSYSFFLDVAEASNEITIWDGDFDHGTNPNLAGNPSGTPIVQCTDDNDANTPDVVPDFALGSDAQPEGWPSPYGDPADDFSSDANRRSPCVFYTVTDPNGKVYTNANPSGNREWEKFVISTDPAATALDADYAPNVSADGVTFVTTPVLPAGSWVVEVHGLDVANSNFWRFEQKVCSDPGGCGAKPVKIGDTVWADQDGDGIEDPGEPGLAGCKVNVYSVPDPQFPMNRELISMHVTDENGMYMRDVTADRTYTVEIADECTMDVPKGSLGDRVWFDDLPYGAGGDRNSTEAGIPNATVRLYLNCDPNLVIGSAQTDSNGFYWFDNLPLDETYCTQVKESTLPDGLSRTNGIGDLSDPTTLTAAVPVDKTLDFGYNLDVATAPGLGDEVWLDADGDGERDSNEAGIEGVVLLLSTCAAPGVVIDAATTDASGFYYFQLPSAGCYRVTVDPSTLPAGLSQTFDKDPVLDGMTEDSVQVGEVRLDFDFGYRGTNDPDLLCISDYTWFDANINGLFGGVSEPANDDFPIEGVTVNLVKFDAAESSVAATVMSDANGFFQFCGLAPGSYVIEITDLDGKLTPYVGTTQPAVDGQLPLVLGDEDENGVNFGYVNQGELAGCLFTTPTSWTMSSGPTGNLDFDFGCRPTFSVGDRVWLNIDGDGDGGDFGEEAGIDAVTVKLTNTDTGATMTATTDATGFYRFDGLLPGNYTVMVDGTTLPAGLAQNFDPDGTLDGMNAFTLAVDLPVNFFKTDVDFGYAEPCALTVEKTCQIVVEPQPFSCSDAKPIDVVSMIWKGGGTVDVTAWKGNVGSTSLGTKSVSDGEEIFFAGFAGSPNDVYWQIKVNGVEIGQSKFHLSCSDSNMNGAEDCGLPQGDGKSDDAGFINDWRLEGLEGSGQVLDCTPTPAPAAQTCDVELGPAPSCETTGDPDFLTWRYTGGGCAASMNSQEPGKVTCDESSPGIDSNDPVTVTAGNDTFSVQPGEEFTIKRSDSDEILLTQPGRYEDQKIHTSCSQPLIAGEIFGSLTLAALDGQRAGATVMYDYLVSNAGPDLVGVTLVDDQLDLGITPFNLARNESQPFSFVTEITETTMNRADAEGLRVDGAGTCSAFATATVNVTEAPEPCTECDGGVKELTFKNVGPAAFITIYDDKDAKANEVLFSGFVNHDEEIPITSRPGQAKFDSNISIWISGQRVALVHTSCSQPIGIGFQFGPLEVTAGRSKNGGIFCDAECAPSQLNFEVKDDEVKFKIENNGATPLQIQRVIAEWPSAKGNLIKVEFDGTIWEGTDAPTTADITDFQGDLDNRALEAGDNHELKLRFSKKTLSGLHFVRVEFNNGCFIEADSDTPASSSFSCSKPIDELTMKWDGGGTVSVTAWKGSVGSTHLGTKTVAQGGEIFFNGFAGSPNDVYWEVFDGTVKRGESKFHLSCSDSEMNGAEDCNKRQGDGKSNESGLINDWLFEGMVDSDETLDCN